MDRHAKVVVILTFALLGFLYVASVTATVIRVGLSEIPETVFRVPEFVVLLLGRAIEAVGCFAIAILSFGSGPRLPLCAGLALILATGAVVLLIGVVSSPRSPWPILWAVALAGVVLQLWGTFCAVRRVSPTRSSR